MQLNSFSTRLYNKLKTNPKLFVFLPLCLYWLFLFALTTIPAENVPRYFDAQDKIEHFVAYFVLAILLTFTLHFQEKVKLFSEKFFVSAVLLIILYATVDEVHQIFIPGRYCDVFDWITDIIGGTAGIIFAKNVIKPNLKDLSSI